MRRICTGSLVQFLSFFVTVLESKTNYTKGLHNFNDEGESDREEGQQSSMEETNGKKKQSKK